MESSEKKRVALGRCVWRMASWADGLHDDSISPSLYAKAQGKTVNIWGFLGNGRLEYYVLPADPDPKKNISTTHTMNG